MPSEERRNAHTPQGDGFGVTVNSASPGALGSQTVRLNLNQMTFWKWVEDGRMTQWNSLRTSGTPPPPRCGCGVSQCRQTGTVREALVDARGSSARGHCTTWISLSEGLPAPLTPLHSSLSQRGVC